LGEIGNKPKSVKEVDGQYMGLIRFTPDSWHEIKRIRGGLTSLECDTIHMTGTLQKVIEAGYIRVVAIPYFNSWGEIDSAQDLASYQE
jgi:hypothetical protein